MTKFPGFSHSYAHKSVIYWLNFLAIYAFITSVIKSPPALLGSKLGHFSVHKFEKSKFLARIHMKYFHMAISVILRVYLIRKYGCAKPKHFYSYFIDFSTSHVPLARFFFLAQFLLPVNWIDYLHSKGPCWAALKLRELK